MRILKQKQREPETGIVAWFNPRIGYGAITPDKPETPDQKLFVHYKFIKQKRGYKTLVKQQRVKYYPIQLGHSLQAHQVEIIK